MEHRCYHRARIAAPVEVRKGNACFGPFYTRDVSLEGLFVRSGMLPTKLEEVVTLRLRLPPRCGGTHEVHALVVHQRPEGMGLLYATWNQRFRDNLRQLLAEAEPSGGREERPARRAAGG